MSPPFLDTAIIKAMQRNPAATRIEIRDEIGCTNDEMRAAIERLRWAGKLSWNGFALSPSLQRDTPGASGTARKAPGAVSSGTAERGSASAPLLDSHPPVGNASGAGGCEGGAGISTRKRPGPSTRPGDDLLARIEAYCRDTGTDETVIGKLLFRHWGFVALLRKRGTLSEQKRQAVEYLLDRHPAGLGRLNDPVHPAVRQTLAEILGHGLLTKAQRRPNGEAHLPPEGPIALPEQVKAEAVETGERRTMARKISATAMNPLPAESLGDRIRRLAREADEEELAAAAEAEAVDRRERDLAELKTISALLRKAQRDWPEQAAAVKNYAAQQHIGLGEAWRRVIAAGCGTVGWKEGRI